LADENRKLFREKESENFSETEGNLKQGEYIIASGGMDAPAYDLENYKVWLRARSLCCKMYVCVHACNNWTISVLGHVALERLVKRGFVGTSSSSFFASVLQGR